MELTSRRAWSGPVGDGHARPRLLVPHARGARDRQGASLFRRDSLASSVVISSPSHSLVPVLCANGSSSLLTTLGLLVATSCFACEGPDPSARARFVEGAGQVTNDAGSRASEGAPAELEPYPDWGDLTSACGAEHVSSVVQALEESALDRDAPASETPLSNDAGTVHLDAESFDAGSFDAGREGTAASDDGSEEPSPPRQLDPNEIGLRDLGYLIGTALATHRLGNAEYEAAAARNFNLVTPENEMKWDATEPTDDRFTFTRGDAIVQFAAENDMLVKGHTLVWHSQLPGWVSQLQGEDAVREAMTDHIEQVMGHYLSEFPGSVVVWDVVNEAIDSRGPQAFFRDSVFYTELGEGFIGEAFTIAHAMDPNALLFYNDYGIEALGAKSNATYEMVEALVDAGVPIDGVGFQMHTRGLDFGPSVSEFRQNLQRFVDLGLLVSITEMDVNLCSGFESRSEAISVQRERYRSLIDVCLEFEACHSISVWGMSDGGSWLNQQQPCDNPRLQPWPLLFTDEFERKPAWWGVFDALSGCTP